MTEHKASFFVSGDDVKIPLKRPEISNNASWVFYNIKKSRNLRRRSVFDRVQRI